jgi:hypothetical protein
MKKYIRIEIYVIVSMLLSGTLSAGESNRATPVPINEQTISIDIFFYSKNLAMAFNASRAFEIGSVEEQIALQFIGLFSSKRYAVMGLTEKDIARDLTPLSAQLAVTYERLHDTERAKEWRIRAREYAKAIPALSAIGDSDKLDEAIGNNLQAACELFNKSVSVRTGGPSRSQTVPINQQTISVNVLFYSSNLEAAFKSSKAFKIESEEEQVALQFYEFFTSKHYSVMDLDDQDLAFDLAGLSEQLAITYEKLHNVYLANKWRARAREHAIVFFQKRAPDSDVKLDEAIAEILEALNKRYGQPSEPTSEPPSQNQ